MKTVDFQSSITELEGVAFQNLPKILIVDLIQQLNVTEEKTDQILRNIRQEFLKINDETSQAMYLKMINAQISLFAKKTYESFYNEGENFLLIQNLIVELKHFGGALDSSIKEMENLFENLKEAFNLSDLFTRIKNESSKQDQLNMYKEFSVSIFNNQNIFTLFPRLKKEIKGEFKNNEVFKNLIFDKNDLLKEVNGMRPKLKEAQQTLKSSEFQFKIKGEKCIGFEKKLKPFKDDYQEDFNRLANTPLKSSVLKNLPWKLAKENFDEFIEVIAEDDSLNNQIAQEIQTITKQIESRPFQMRTENQKELEKYGIRASDAINKKLLQDLLVATKKRISEISGSFNIKEAIGGLFFSSELETLTKKAGFIEESLKDIQNDSQKNEKEIKDLNERKDQLILFEKGFKKLQADQVKLARSNLKESKKNFKETQKKYDTDKVAFKEQNKYNQYLIAQDILHRNLVDDPLKS